MNTRYNNLVHFNNVTVLAFDSLLFVQDKDPKHDLLKIGLKKK
jgi:hypothetical protein